jgi:hypothetical protein
MRRRKLVAGILTLALCACGHMPVTSIYRLRNADFATADPALLRAAVRIPAALMPLPAGVNLDIKISTEGGSDGREEHFVLRELTSETDLAALQSERRAGFAIHVFRIDPADLPRIRELQATRRQLRPETRQQRRGSLGISAAACRTGAVPDGPLLFTTYILLDPRDGYVPLTVDVDLRAIVQDKDLDSKFSPCH